MRLGRVIVLEAFITSNNYVYGFGSFCNVKLGIPIIIHFIAS